MQHQNNFFLLCELQRIHVEHQLTTPGRNVESVVHLHVRLTHFTGQRQPSCPKHLADANIQLTPRQVLPYAVPTSYTERSL